MREKLESIREVAKSRLQEVKDRKALDELRVYFLGKKGELTSILKQMGKLSQEERPIIGQLANEVRSEIESFIEKRGQQLKEEEQNARLATERIDVTMPGKHN